MTANVAAGPDAAINTPPIAGPTALAMLNATLLSETAAESSGFGTSSGTIASHAGPFSAAPRPRKNVSSKRAVGFMSPSQVMTARAVATTSIQVCVKRSSFRRSITSASAPAGSERRNIGRLAAVWIKATINAEGLSEVINHAAPTF